MGGTVKRAALAFFAATIGAGAPIASRTNTPSDWISAIETLASPAGNGSAQPQLSVQGHRLLLSWMERSGDVALLRFSDRTGVGWSEPRTVANGSHFFVNWADVPSVVRLADGSL